MTSPKLIIFDLDGTLTPSKSPLEADMSATLDQLLQVKKVLVIGGGAPKQFFSQFIAHLNIQQEKLSNLYLMPTSGSQLYQHTQARWELIYSHELTANEKSKITSALKAVLLAIGHAEPTPAHGELIEDRGSQISFSALGQQAPLDLKSKWDPDQKKRLAIIDELKHHLPEFDIKIGGTTTIDITKKGINKAFGVREISKYLKIDITDAVYIGDALYEHGNDAIVKESGIKTIPTSGPTETKEIIADIIKNS